MIYYLNKKTLYIRMGIILKSILRASLKLKYMQKIKPLEKSINQKN